MDQNYKIVVVDDETSILDVFKKYLERTTDYTVFVEQNGLHALELIKREKIDCCFIDITMPVIDGIELAKQIHLIDNTIPIVVMTGYPSYENVVNTLKNGVVDFLTKPIEMSQIQLTIQRVMRERSLFIDRILLKEATKKNEELQKINVELQQKLKEVEIINLILQKLDQATTSKDLFKALVDLAGEITRCDEAHFYIFTTDAVVPLTIASFSRLNQKPVAGTGNLAASIKKVMDEGIPIISHDLSETGATMTLPLKIKSNTLGVLGLIIHDKIRYFQEKDLYFMNFLVNNASYLVENMALYENINENLFSTLYAFVEAIEARDSYTKQHSTRVSQFAMLIAETMHYPLVEMESLNISGILHDIGKIGIPDNILLKPGKLTDEEFEIIKKHPTIGSNIIGHLGMWVNEQQIIRHHHERFDGRGYPDRLKGNTIPKLSRILSVADVYDALTSDRSYRQKMEPAVAIKIITENSGSQFDPHVVEKFLAIPDLKNIGL